MLENLPSVSSVLEIKINCFQKRPKQRDRSKGKGKGTKEAEPALTLTQMVKKVASDADGAGDKVSVTECWQLGKRPVFRSVSRLNLDTCTSRQLLYPRKLKTRLAFVFRLSPDII